MTTYTGEQVRALDGRALTRVAWELGLHPLCGSGFTYEDVCVNTRMPWAPHITLTQADALFRSLRARGWQTTIVHAPDGPHFVSAIQWRIRAESYDVRFDIEFESPHTQTTEAHALTLCTVLAVLSEGQKEPQHG